MVLDFATIGKKTNVCHPLFSFFFLISIRFLPNQFCYWFALHQRSLFIVFFIRFYSQPFFSHIDLSNQVGANVVTNRDRNF